MASFYVIAQYVPDPIAGERMNIGVFAYEEGSERVICYFLEDWKRVKCFGGEKIDFLQAFGRSSIESSFANKEQARERGFYEANITPEQLQEMCVHWANSIQFTKPRGFLWSAERTMEYAKSHLLHQLRPEKREYHTRIQAASVARKIIEKTVRAKIGDMADAIVNWNKKIPGAKEEHKFDVVVGNGIPFYVTHGLSFEGPDSELRNKEISEIGFRVQDVRILTVELPIAIAAYAPREDSNDAYGDYKRTQNLFKQMNAQVIPIDKFDEWSQEQAENASDKLQEYAEKKTPAHLIA